MILGIARLHMVIQQSGSPYGLEKNIKCSVYLIVGENDKRCTPEMHKRIYANLSGPKELWIVPKAGHGVTAKEMPEVVAQAEFRRRIQLFFGKWLKLK